MAGGRTGPRAEAGINSVPMNGTAGIARAVAVRSALANVFAFALHPRRFLDSPGLLPAPGRHCVWCRSGVAGSAAVLAVCAPAREHLSFIPFCSRSTGRHQNPVLVLPYWCSCREPDGRRAVRARGQPKRGSRDRLGMTAASATSAGSVSRFLRLFPPSRHDPGVIVASAHCHANGSYSQRMNPGIAP